ncbi:MAG: hypothetical protein NT001_01675 [Candidatus Woesearchaeota archaeon]|nr:hypothetical protein [Candidatus Woesearchaeota archaeon]
MSEIETIDKAVRLETIVVMADTYSKALNLIPIICSGLIIAETGYFLATGDHIIPGGSDKEDVNLLFEGMALCIAGYGYIISKIFKELSVRTKHNLDMLNQEIELHRPLSPSYFQ